MEIPQSSSAITTSRPPSEAESQSGISSDFETFLRMLTAQMKNQDEVYIVQSEAEIDLLVGRFHHRHLNFVLVNIHLRVHRVNWSSMSHLDPNRLCKLLMSSSVDTDTPLIPLYRHICEAI